MKYRSMKTMTDRNQMAAMCRKPVYQRSTSPAVPASNEYLLRHEGVSVIVTTHARLQGFKRYGMSTDNMTDYFTRVAVGLKNYPWKYDDQEIFVYSRHFQRGCIMTHRSDYRTNEKCLVAVTLYPYGKAVPMKQSTDKVYVN